MGELRKILHVEDDPDIREIVSICLGVLGGYDLRQCSGGAEALEVAPEFAPDLFVFDLMMPGMSGVDTLRAMREIPELAEIPAIFVTSVTVAEEFRAEVQDLAIGAIQKPFDAEKLASQVHEIWAEATQA